MSERDYVLGTHDDEVARLGLQHQIWRPHMLQAWQRAGFAPGQRILDVGCGPGYATSDLAELVGPTGAVLGVERSERYAGLAAMRAQALGHRHVAIETLDLMTDDLAPTTEGAFDAAWCRWLAIFVASPQRLVETIAAALRPGGVVVFHEYFDYGTWQVTPVRPELDEFTAAVMRSWRAAGGDPDVARKLPKLLTDAGFALRAVQPHIFAVRPHELWWQWPQSFIKINLERMVATGVVDAGFAARAQAAFDESSRDPAAVLMTPLVLEIIAEKR